ncbi:hypothetical protein GCM10010513_16720 [Streptomyces glebosus]|nr:hypothetical protein GCM10010513_16720 [Streptomyces glebosus]
MRSAPVPSLWSTVSRHIPIADDGGNHPLTPGVFSCIHGQGADTHRVWGCDGQLYQWGSPCVNTC